MLPDKIAPEIRPFPLVRYYMLASLVVIAIALSVVNLIAHRVERASVIARLEQESVDASHLIAFALAERLSLEARAVSTDAIAMIEDRSIIQRLVLNAIMGQPVVRLDIMSPEGRILFSTDPRTEEQERITAESEPALLESLAGNEAARYMGNRQIVRSNGELQTFNVVETLVPVYNETASAGRSQPPYAVFSIYRDVTQGVDAAASSVRTFRLIAVAGTMAALFLALLFVVIKGQNVIRRSSRRLADLLSRERLLRTELDHQNRELQAANDSKLRLMSTVSHELNNPLASIAAFADILRKNVDGNLSVEQVDQLELIRRNTHRLTSLISDLTDLARIQRGQLEIEPESFSLSMMLEETALSMEVVLEQKGQTLDVEIPDSDITVDGDCSRLGQAVTNLVSNASKYSPEGAQIDLIADINGRVATVAVRDEGIGISESDQAKLFTEFFRADNPETRSAPGTGLGLVIVKSIVEAHGGTIDLDSVAGEGTTVRLTVPLERPEEAPAVSDGSGAVPERMMKPPTPGETAVEPRPAAAGS